MEEACFWLNLAALLYNGVYFLFLCAYYMGEPKKHMLCTIGSLVVTVAAVGCDYYLYGSGDWLLELIMIFTLLLLSVDISELRNAKVEKSEKH